MALLELERVSRQFTTPEGGAYPAIADVSLAVDAGAFVAIVGPSGCGKSTLLNVAAGLLAPTTGQVRVDGVALTGVNRRATYMFQQDALLPWKTVRENVALGLTLAGAAAAEANRQADAWLGRVGLARVATHYPAQLSGGMRKRAIMAQNWIIDRAIVLMDEPFSALDVHTRLQMESELLALWDDRTVAAGATVRKKTVLFVTHDLEEAIALADEVIILSAGPAARIVGRQPVPLARPRDLMELRTQESFVSLYRTLWAVLRDEVLKSRATERRHE
jgi:NitT/TauT family transport system ATP-binding protein